MIEQSNDPFFARSKMTDLSLSVDETGVPSMSIKTSPSHIRPTGTSCLQTQRARQARGPTLPENGQ